MDINYAVVNRGNTITPYTADFAVGDAEIRQMLANGEIVTQLIAWQDKHVSDVQFCEPRLISENRIVGRAVLRIPLLGWVKITFVCGIESVIGNQNFINCVVN